MRIEFEINFSSGKFEKKNFSGKFEKKIFLKILKNFLVDFRKGGNYLGGQLSCKFGYDARFSYSFKNFLRIIAIFHLYKFNSRVEKGLIRIFVITKIEMLEIFHVV